MRLCFDLDTTLCIGRPYEEAIPLPGAADLLRTLKTHGHYIIIDTARGMGSSNGSVGRAIASIGELTLTQLKEWGFEYDELHFGKPSADIYIDDKALHFTSISDLQIQFGDVWTNQ